MAIDNIYIYYDVLWILNFTHMKESQTLFWSKVTELIAEHKLDSCGEKQKPYHIITTITVFTVKLPKTTYNAYIYFIYKHKVYLP